ncbi:MAG: hypothetical protein KGL35_19710 [Bradyrhizobium sp.]|nr:hypothetical protein [Bradyrhizobium sp.]
MADIADNAQVWEDGAREDGLKKRYAILQPCGACHYCNEPLHTGLLFCNRDCRDDYEAWQDAQRRNGK